jgi:hypothetical protein
MGKPFHENKPSFRGLPDGRLNIAKSFHPLLSAEESDKPFGLITLFVQRIVKHYCTCGRRVESRLWPVEGVLCSTKATTGICRRRAVKSLTDLVRAAWKGRTPVSLTFPTL